MWEHPLRYLLPPRRPQNTAAAARTFASPSTWPLVWQHRRLLYRAILVALWVCFIWAHSLMNGTDSANESTRFVLFALPLLQRLGLSDIALATFVVRKCAHVSEYAMLGVLAFFLCRSQPGVRPERRLWLSSRVVMVMTPIVDETIQLFVPGREGSVRDVFIDLAGVCIGYALARALCALCTRSHRGCRASRG